MRKLLRRRLATALPAHRFHQESRTIRVHPPAGGAETVQTLDHYAAVVIAAFRARLISYSAVRAGEDADLVVTGPQRGGQAIPGYDTAAAEIEDAVVAVTGNSLLDTLHNRKRNMAPPPDFLKPYAMEADVDCAGPRLTVLDVARLVVVARSIGVPGDASVVVEHKPGTDEVASLRTIIRPPAAANGDHPQGEVFDRAL